MSAAILAGLDENQVPSWLLGNALVRRIAMQNLCNAVIQCRLILSSTRVPDPSRPSGFRLTGDVKFDEVAPKCSYITPVPGGVGPMTICP